LQFSLKKVGIFNDALIFLLILADLHRSLLVLQCCAVCYRTETARHSRVYQR